MDMTLRQSRKETQPLALILPLILAARAFEPRMAEEEAEDVKRLQRDKREDNTEKLQPKTVQAFMIVNLGEMEIQGYGSVKAPLVYTMGTYTRSSAVPTYMNSVVAPNGAIGTMVTSQSDEFDKAA